jgi:hypothetical protein
MVSNKNWDEGKNKRSIHERVPLLQQPARLDSPDRTENPFLPDFRLVKKIVGESGTGF